MKTLESIAFVAILVARGAIAQPAQTPSAARDLAGWSDLRWGMTTTEAAPLHPEGAWKLGRLLIPTRILDQPFDAEAIFTAGRLSKIEIEWASISREKAAYLETFKALNEALRAKYGAPTVIGEEERKWSLPRTIIELAIRKKDVPASAPAAAHGFELWLIYSDSSGGNPKGNL